MREMAARVAGSATLLVGMAVVYLLAVRTTRGQDLDQRTYLEMFGADSWRVLVHRVGFASVTDPLLWIVAAVGITALGLLAHRRLGIILLLVMPVIGIVIVRLLRDEILPRPELIDITRAGFNTFPSGHTAAAAGCVAAAIRAAPRLLAPVVTVVGAMWVTIVGQGLMEVGAHRPSDVIGSILFVSALMILIPNGGRATGISPLGSLTVAGVAAIGPVIWAAYTGHLVVGAVGVVAAVAFASLTVGGEPRSRGDRALRHDPHADDAVRTQRPAH